MPPWIELHRHLDASFRLTTLRELCEARGLVTAGTSLADFARRVVLTAPMADLAEVLDAFVLYQQLFDRPDVLERLAFECVEDVAREGTRAVELRYSPGFVSERHGLGWEEVLEAIRRGVARARADHPVDVGLICIATRDHGPDEAARTAAFYLDHCDDFVGFDLAGNEVGFPPRVFEAALAPLRAAMAADPRLRLTCHAGEAAGADHVWEAIERLGATRIGHGVHSVEDPALVAHLRDRRIGLEVCPTSNWITRCVPSLEEHPIRELVRAGVPVSINTDDPALFGNTLPHELAVCRERVGMTGAELEACRQAAWETRFLTAGPPPSDAAAPRGR